MNMYNKNPWLGLASYDEKAILAGYKFCGRVTAIQELFAKIDNNLFTTLYGKSGVGKTSLIQAGIFPKLRANGYFPVILRLGLYNESYASVIVDGIAQTAVSYEVKCIRNEVSLDQNDDSYLRHFFKTTEFRDDSGQIVFPVIVLDQFEELFFKDKFNLEHLMKQLYSLVDDNSLYNSSEPYDVTNYRILVSLREDDLFYFEDIIDRLRLNELKFNRHRLREMTFEEAASVITEPGYALWDEEGIDEIVKMILSLSKGEDDEINTAILSLVCNRLFESAKKQDVGIVSSQYVKDFLQSTSDSLFMSYYRDVKNKLQDSSQWYYIEDQLVTEDGRRKSVLESEFSKYVHDSDFLFEGDFTMLRYVTVGIRNERQVEIIHDTLAKAISYSRKERKLKETLDRQKRKNRQITGVALLIMIVMAVVAYQYYMISRNRDDMLISQSRYLMSEAALLIESGDVNLAAKLLLYALPKNLDKPDRPYVEEVGMMLQSFNDVWSGCPVTSPMRHDGQVNSARFSPDSKYVVTASYDGTARVWDACSGEPVSPPMLHDAPVNVAVFSPDGRYVVTASDNCSARVWDAINGTPVSLPMLHYDKVTCAEFSYDGKYVLTASDDGSTRVWEACSGEPVTMELHVSPFRTSIECAHFSQDGCYVLSASFFIVKVWDAYSGELVCPELNHEEADVFDANFSPDGSRIVSAASDGVVRIWDVSSGELIMSIDDQAGMMLHSAVYSPDGKYVLTSSAGSIARVWDADTGEPVSPQIEYTKEVRRGLVAYGQVRFSPDGNHIATGSYSGLINVWNTRTWESRTLFTLSHFCSDIDFSPDGKNLVTASGDGTAQVWNICAGVAVPSVMVHDGPIDCAEYSPDGTTVATVCYKNGLRFWNARTGELIMSHHMQDFHPTDIEYAPDGNTLVMSDGDSVLIYDIKSDTFTTCSIKHENKIYDMNFISDSLVTVTCNRNVVSLWEVPTGKLIVKLTNHIDVNGVAISPDGKVVAIAHANGVNIWNLSSETPEQRILHHDSQVFSMDFSPDGEYLVTGASNNIVRIWDLNKEEATILPLPSRCPSMNTLDFSYDGKFVVAATEGYGEHVQVFIWNIEKNELIVCMSPHESDAFARFSPDGTRILTYSSDGTARIFSAVPLQNKLDRFNEDPFVDWKLDLWEKDRYYLQ